MCVKVISINSFEESYYLNLFITLDELKSRIAKNKNAEEDLIESSAKKKKNK